MTTYTGHMANGAVVFDGPPPPDGTRVRLEVSANGTPPPAAPPVDRTPLTLTPEDEAVIPPDIAEMLRTNPDGLCTRALEVILLSWHENPAGDGPDDLPVVPQHALDLPTDAAAQIDHYLYGTAKR